MNSVEHIEWNDELLACIVRAEAEARETIFLTPPSHIAQLGFIVRPAGGVIPTHVHLPIERHILGTFEVLLVKKGRCEVDIYSPRRELVATRELRVGDVLLITEGAHGYRMLEDTIFLEIKQGPYNGQGEKKQY